MPSQGNASNASDEYSCEEEPIQMTDEGIQVSDDSKNVKAELTKKISS